MVDVMLELRLRECGDREPFKHEFTGEEFDLCKPNGNPHCPYRPKNTVLVKGEHRFPCTYNNKA